VVVQILRARNKIKPTHAVPVQELGSLSGLVCDLQLRIGPGLSPECALPEEYLGHNLNEHCSEDTGPLGALLTFSPVIQLGIHHPRKNKTKWCVLSEAFVVHFMYTRVSLYTSCTLIHKRNSGS